MWLIREQKHRLDRYGCITLLGPSCVTWNHSKRNCHYVFSACIFRSEIKYYSIFRFFQFKISRDSQYQVDVFLARFSPGLLPWILPILESTKASQILLVSTESVEKEYVKKVVHVSVDLSSAFSILNCGPTTFDCSETLFDLLSYDHPRYPLTPTDRIKAVVSSVNCIQEPTENSAQQIASTSTALQLLMMRARQ